ncbi:MAG: elongation factor P maturation arginine rhamnosyltransferase EarP [Rhizobacter sp.]
MSMSSSENPRVGRIWDVFCRVVDNHGDAGVCWRLAADLASRGIAVRLWIDDARALAWMAPGGRTGIDVLPWPSTDRDVSTNSSNAAAEVVVEAFGCGLPEPCLRYLAAQQSTLAPVWINLEYLTAERSAERNHRLPSPQHSGPARGLTSWFFYPGFTTGTGGLLREKDLLNRQAAFDRDKWLAEHSISRAPGERLVSLFCYENANVPRLLRWLAERPTLLLTTPGHATRQVKRALEGAGISDRLRVQALPWLTQTDYDHLLWSCDLNFVRGEDSLVRAIWAGRPFVWQIYPQDDGAHQAKLAAFSARNLANVDPARAAEIRSLGWCWNGLAGAGDSNWNILNSSWAMSVWAAHCVKWRDELLGQPDLASQLLAFTATQGAREDAKI